MVVVVLVGLLLAASCAAAASAGSRDKDGPGRGLIYFNLHTYRYTNSSSTWYYCTTVADDIPEV